MRCIAVLALFLLAVNAQEKYRLCATDKVTEDTCYALKRGDSKVSCVRVTDSAECAIRLATGDADFGVFDAEELLLAYQFYPEEIVPIFQLRHQDRKDEDFQFQSVAVVPSSVTPEGHASDFKSLRDGGLCHPGFSDAQWWNDYILKYFERKVASAECQTDQTVVENEARNIKNFFGKACRPGEWAIESPLDSVLKSKYPELCALCDDPQSCSYTNGEKHGHIGALDCLKSGRGKVAYVALTYVNEYLKSNDSYQFLCPDGTVQPLSTTAPCAWIQQPWPVIAARNSIAPGLAELMKQWLVSVYSGPSWVETLNLILQEDSVASPLAEGTSIISYLSKGREAHFPNAQSCKHSPIRWCTIGDLETNKCKWIAKAAKGLGIEPEILCKQSASTFQCFRDIAADKADIIAIDSNYGHLARKVFGLTTVMYSETEQEKYSTVVAVTREGNKNQIKSFEDLKDRKACFPEYGGIAWLSFLKVLRENGIVSSTSCDYAKITADFLSGACAPGIRDSDHTNGTKNEERPEVIEILCSSCPTSENNSFCAASDKNPYYGDHGALDCLKKSEGDIAIVEAGNIRALNINQTEYRILCKNGSLANSAGFRVDSYCPLSVTIDSEVVGRRNSSETDVLDTVLALLKIENWLGYRAKTHRPIRIYDKFNGTMDLLFKDSTAGLVDNSSSIKGVLAYKDLFNHVDTCSAAPISNLANVGLVAFLLFYSYFSVRVL